MAEHKTSHIYSVSHLTREIKTLLEERFPFVWITGEISNYAAPASGHSYFSLKDAGAVINCVMFKNQKRNLKFSLENGLTIVGLARLSVYEPQGAYQLIFEHMVPEGAGALQKAFEQLKKKLADEGLFDPVHKKTVPLLPGKVSVITSGTGAAVRDILQISLRRFPGCCLEIVPVSVQGNAAIHEVVYAIETVNNLAQSDVIILARGGGSLEDLAAFNSEEVARAVFASRIPVITGIGHETDFTIADFVADVRAPTPSAAAELALPEKKQLIRHLFDMHEDLNAFVTRQLAFYHQKLDDLHSRLKRPDQIAAQFRQTVISHCRRMAQSLQRRIFHDREKLRWITQALPRGAPDVLNLEKQLTALNRHLDLCMRHHLEAEQNRVEQAGAALSALNPNSVLNRGYSIARSLPDRKVLLDAGMVNVQDPVEIILARGRVLTRVEKTIHGKNHV